jgi:hypothetical protein
LHTKESYDVAGAKVELLKIQASPLVRAQSTISVTSIASVTPETIPADGEVVTPVPITPTTPIPTTPTPTTPVPPVSGAPEWLLRVKLISKKLTLELGVETREDALEWAKAIT